MHSDAADGCVPLLVVQFIPRNYRRPDVTNNEKREEVVLKEAVTRRDGVLEAGMPNPLVPLSFSR